MLSGVGGGGGCSFNEVSVRDPASHGEVTFDPGQPPLAVFGSAHHTPSLSSPRLIDPHL